MTQNLSEYLHELHGYYQRFIYNNGLSLFCNLVLPTPDPLSFAIQLPINVFLLATIPFRFLFCTLFDTQINIACVFFNFFPFISVACPLLSTQQLQCSEFYNQCCLQSCNQIANSNNPIIKFLVYVCNNCPQSVFNYLFCVASYVFLDVTSPILILMYPIFDLIGQTPPCIFPEFNCSFTG